MRILFVGDTHGNATWWRNVVRPTASAIAADGIIQVGDFGFWPTGRHFIDAAADTDPPVWWIDGNHEHHHELAKWAADARRTTGAGPFDPLPMRGALTYLPRGARLELAGTQIAALGGARSIDRLIRRPGLGWFPGEAISDDDIAAVAAGGRADVLVTHDTFDGYRIPGLPPVELLSHAWQAERPACEAHRSQVGRAVDAVRPRLVVHGHYHTRYHMTVERSWGQVRVEGLDRDGTDEAMIVVDLPDLTVEPVTRRAR
jgi:hypothetical protein